MIKLDENKLAKLRTSSEHLTEKYGELGSPEREEFEARAKAYYYAELLKGTAASSRRWRSNSWRIR